MPTISRQGNGMDIVLNSFVCNMKRLSEGYKMFLSVMTLFFLYGVFFIVFEDYDRRTWTPLADELDWHLLWFSLVVMALLAFLLLHYARCMDNRINREQTLRQTMIRRELTQNISHELKTPVASILGYIDTLIANPDISETTRAQFLERSREQAQRLTSLLKDLSTLNQMDYARDVLEWQPVNITALLNDLKQEMSLTLEQHQMQFSLQLNVMSDIIVVGNSSLLYSIFRNLLDNAINYAGKGSSVIVSATEQADHWLFSFSDNGVGVQQEHLPRLFERFYRVDKGRSRQMGGTGLGLAIVKNAVNIHGGNISVSTSNSGGLCFEFTLCRFTHLS